jgi:CAAX prenyl protease-like protein
MPSKDAVARCAPFGVFIALLMLGSIVREPWLIVARGGIVAIVLLWFWRHYHELRLPRAVPWSDWALAIAAGFAVFGAWIWLDQGWATFSRSPGFDPLHEDGQMNWPLALIRLSGLALVVPVMEELFWRSFLLRWLERHDFVQVVPRSVGTRALIITTVLFALEHSQWLAGAVAGIAYSLLYVRTGNLWVPILAHAVTNGALGVWILATRNWHFW